jgi:hypothetical protein
VIPAAFQPRTDIYWSNGCAAVYVQTHRATDGALLAILGDYGSVRGYLASFPDAHSAAGDLRRRFRFLGDAGVWRLLTSAARDADSGSLNA